MPRNLSTLDRAVRTGAAVLAVVLALATGAASVAGIVLLAVAAVLLVTSAAGFCPLYTVFRFTTRRRDQACT
jgi:hypothetical protein